MVGADKDRRNQMYFFFWVVKSDVFYYKEIGKISLDYNSANLQGSATSLPPYGPNSHKKIPINPTKMIHIKSMCILYYLTMELL
jgi:hypothetical protein